ncbi:MAG TPA: plastocyanin/azurin family copper-binding protein [Actinomycetota bacterium]|nr:plastocyanin/azurin family copper-binding protein [Actinomycetota bacterium]
MVVRRVVVGAVLALGLVALLASTAPGATFRVRASGSPGSFAWDPDFRHITKGNRIKWTNPTDYTHRVVAYKGRWSKRTTIAPGEATTKRFRRAGAYYYRCTRTGHSTLSSDGTCNGMCGEIHVTRN